MKGKPARREDSLSFLEKLSKDEAFTKEHGVTIEKLLISFGWPDFVVLMKGENAELIKHGIVALRELLEKNGDSVETSTMICTTQESIEEKKREWAMAT